MKTFDGLGNNESAGKRKSGKTRKGNAWVRRLLCEFAQAAARSRCALKDKFAALSIRKGHKKSIVALAHKILRIVFAVIKTFPLEANEVSVHLVNAFENALLELVERSDTDVAQERTRHLREGRFHQPAPSLA